MNKVQPKQNNESRSIGARRILIWIVSVAIFIVLLSSVIELFIKYKGIRRHIKELKSDRISLEQKKNDLVETNEFIKTPEGQERIFRDKYRLVKPGEGIIIITEPVKTEDLAPKKPVFRRFWDSIRSGLGL
jgi:cell division protein FtsB